MEKGTRKQWAGLAALLTVLWAGPLGAQVADPNASPDPPPVMYADASVASIKRLSLEQLMELDVTSVDKQPEPFGEAAAAIQVITNDEIMRSGATSIPEALRLADNLEVAQKDSHDWAISARGFDTDLSNKLLVLFDGRSVYSPLFSGVFWDVQDYLLEDLDRIEVISGPGGTLWGANAVNGVINIISKSAKDTQGIYLENGFGTELQDFYGARYGGTLGTDAYFRIYEKYFQDGNQYLTNGNAASDSWSMGQGGFRVDAYNADQTFTLQGDLYTGNANIPTGGNSPVAGGNILGRWTKTFSATDNLSLQAYYDYNNLNDPVQANVNNTGVTLAPAGSLIDNLYTYDIELQDHFVAWNVNSVTWGAGVQYTSDNIQSAPGLAYTPSPLDQTLYNCFLQDEIRVLDNLFLTLGSKMEHNDYTGFEFEPSARIKWDLNPNQMLWAAVSRAVRTPSEVERNESVPTPKVAPYIDDTLVGNNNFVSEVLIAYELGYRGQWDRNLSSSISTFFNNYTDIRSLNQASSLDILGLPLPYYFANNLLAQTYGVEFTTDYQVLDGWRMHVGYDYLHETVWVAPGQTDVNNALNETADPPNQVFVRASVDLPAGFTFDPAFRWIDAFTYNAGGTPGTQPAYAELDARLGFQVTKEVEVSVTGQSLLHNYHQEYVPSSPSPIEEIARSVYGKVSCQF